MINFFPYAENGLGTVFEVLAGGRVRLDYFWPGLWAGMEGARLSATNPSNPVALVHLRLKQVEQSTKTLKLEGADLLKPGDVIYFEGNPPGYRP